MSRQDFPECWDGPSVTVEVEAKAKEVAVLKLMKQLSEQWFVYILKCSDGSIYTGIAKDVKRRLEQHNAGTASRFTLHSQPFARHFWFTERSSGTRSMALKRELAIKALPRKAKEGQGRRFGSLT